MKAAIIAIGSEMLGPARVDTNSLKVTAALEDFAQQLERDTTAANVFVRRSNPRLTRNRMNDLQPIGMVRLQLCQGGAEDRARPSAKVIPASCWILPRLSPKRM